MANVGHLCYKAQEKSGQGEDRVLKSEEKDDGTAPNLFSCINYNLTHTTDKKNQIKRAIMLTTASHLTFVDTSYYAPSTFYLYIQMLRKQTLGIISITKTILTNSLVTIASFLSTTSLNEYLFSKICSLSTISSSCLTTQD